METQFFQQMFQKHDSIMLLLDPITGQFLESNLSANRFYGYTAAQMKQMTINQINMLPAAEVARIEQAARHEECNCFIVPHRLASGEIRMVEVHSSPIMWENKTFLFNIIRDITQNKQLEEFLRQKEAQGLIQKLFATIPTPVFYKDSQGKYLACNQALAERLGKSVAEVIGLTVFDLFPEAVAQRYHESDLAVLSEPPHHQVYEDKVYNHVLQEERDWLITKSVIRDEQGQIIGLVGVMIDITERKQAEAALRESEQKFRTVVDVVSEGIILVNQTGQIVLANSQVTRLFDYSTEELVGQPIDMLLPERYRDHHHNYRTNYLAHPVTRRMGEGRDLVGRRKDGREFPLEIGLSSAELEREPITICCIADITERKQAEAALRESEQKLKTLLELLPIGITTLDMNNKVSYMNPMLAKILQISPENLARGDYGPRSYFYPDGTPIPNSEHATSRALNKQEAVYNFETGVRIDDNEMFWVKVTAIPVNFSDWRVIAIMNDITERKRLQIELEAAKERMEQLAIYDLLTGVYNRVLLGEKLTEALTQRDDALVAILIMDVDHFKQINDTYGHHEGDYLLIEVVARMKKLLRQADTLVRLGGDEFLLIAPGLKSQAQVEAIASRLLKTVQQPIELAGATVSPTLSIGLALCPHDGTTPQALMVNSDNALYEAKRKGRNCYAFPSR